MSACELDCDLELEPDSDSDQTSSPMRDIPGKNLLSATEEVELSKRVIAGDIEARNVLVERNQRLVWWVLRRYFPNMWAQFDDLVQDGTIGLMTAAQKFDYRRGTRFTTMATRWIRSAIQRAILADGMIRIPERMQQVARKAGRLEHTVGATPEAVGVSSKEMRDALMACTSRDVRSLEAVDPDGRALAETLPHPTAVSPEVYAQARDELAAARSTINEFLTFLLEKTGFSERSIAVFSLRYGLDGGGQKTPAEVAVAFGIDRSRSRQIVSNIWGRATAMGCEMNPDTLAARLAAIELLEEIVLSAG